MSLLTPAPPPDCLAAFAHGLPAFLSGDNCGSAGPVIGEKYIGNVPRTASIPNPANVGMGDGLMLNPPHIAAAQHVFVMTLTEAASTKGMIRPAASGWRIFAGEDGYTVLGRMVRKPSQPWKLTAVLYGARVADALAASASLARLPQVLKEDYELRFLAIPALSVEAFWLRSQTEGSPDLVVPFPEGAKQIVKALGTAEVYTLPVFLATIRPLAVSRLRAPATYGG